MKIKMKTPVFGSALFRTVTAALSYTLAALTVIIGATPAAVTLTLITLTSFPPGAVAMISAPQPQRAAATRDASCGADTPASGAGSSTTAASGPGRFRNRSNGWVIIFPRL